MRRAIREHALSIGLMVVIAIGALAITGYVLRQQGVRLPYIEASPLQLEAELPTAQGVVPGQGQLVTVAGARVGKVGDVKLVDGRARVQIEIDPKYKTLVREGATALLRPRTPLKDMMVELDPGRPPAKVARKGYVIPVQNTLPDGNQDEVLATLDGDTRDYLKLLIAGGGTGLDARGADLGHIFARFEPTHRDIARVSTAVAARRRALRDLIGSLASLNGELARQPRQLTRLVDASAETFDRIAGRSRELRASLREFPSALATSRRAFASTGTLARTLRPTVTALTPAVRRLRATDRQLLPLARVATPLLRERIRPFVRASRPLVAEARPGVHRAAVAAPELRRSFRVFNHFVNMLAYDPHRGQGPWAGKGTAGYLFWLAWGAHNGSTLFSSQDANNIYRQVAVGMGCDAIQDTIDANPAADFLGNLSAILNSPLGCAKR